jgi:hypothetical protein
MQTNDPNAPAPAPAGAAPETAAPAAPAPDPAVLKAELLRERFDAVATRAGLADDVVDIVGEQAHRWLEREGKEATRENISAYLDDLRSRSPRLFARAASPAPAPKAPPRDTAPAAPPAPAPAPAALESPYARWRALQAAGRTDEAKAFFLLNARAINRSA